MWVAMCPLLSGVSRRPQEEAPEPAAPSEEGGPARNGTGPGPGPGAGPERPPAAGLPRQSRSLELPAQNSDHGPHTLPRQKVRGRTPAQAEGERPHTLPRQKVRVRTPAQAEGERPHTLPLAECERPHTARTEGDRLDTARTECIYLNLQQSLYNVNVFLLSHA